MTNTNEYKIRFRQRTGYMREIAGYGSWNEFQVVQGRKVISRHGTEDQAQKAINNLTGSPMTNTPDTDWRDLVKRLRYYKEQISRQEVLNSADFIERQGEEIERQAKEIARLKDALKHTLSLIDAAARVAL